MPAVQVLHEKFADNDRVVILAMNVGDENAKAEKYWADNKFTFPTLHDADELSKAYGIKAFPSSILIGPDGKVVYATVGSAHDVESQLEELLKALESD